MTGETSLGVRRFEPGDEAALAAIAAACGDPPGHSARHAQETWVAERGGAVLGYVAAGRGEILALRVTPEMWGRGAGLTLLSKALAHLRSQGGRDAVAWLPERDEAARAFFERHRFRPSGAVRTTTHGERELAYRAALYPDP